MQLFGTALTRATRDPLRATSRGGALAYGGGPERTVADQMRFDGFGWALVECFLVFAGEGWSERMYAVMEHTGNGAAAVYYVFILVFGQCVFRAPPISQPPKPLNRRVAAPNPARRGV